MRLQHNISPPLPGRGNRKRKRPDPEDHPSPASTPAPSVRNSHANQPAAGELHTTKDEDEFGEFVDFDGDITRHGASVGPNGTPPPPILPPISHSQNPEASSTPFGAVPPPETDKEADLSDIPPSLSQHYDSTRRTIFERRVPQVRYLIAKAKFRWLLSEHELLLDELDTVRKEEERMRASVDAVLDRVLIKELG